MAGWQKVTTDHNEKINNRSVLSIEWKQNTIPTAEAITLLNLVWYIYNITKYIIRGLLIIYTDNKKVARAVNSTLSKTLQVATDGAESIEEFKRLINKLNYTVKINHQ